MAWTNIIQYPPYIHVSSKEDHKHIPVPSREDSEPTCSSMAPDTAPFTMYVKLQLGVSQIDVAETLRTFSDSC